MFNSGLKCKILCFSMVLFLIFITCTYSKKLVLTRNGLTDFTICLPADPSDVEKRAASELQKYIYEMSGTELQIINSEETGDGFQIFLGSAGKNNSIPAGIDWEFLEKDGFTIKTYGNNLIIAGGSENGILYG